MLCRQRRPIVRLYHHMEEPDCDMVEIASLSKDRQAEFAADQLLMVPNAAVLEKGTHFEVSHAGQMNAAAPTSADNTHQTFAISVLAGGHSPYKVCCTCNAGHVFLFLDGTALPYHPDEVLHQQEDKLNSIRRWVEIADTVCHKATPCWE